MSQSDKTNVETFINPAGFVEQHYRGLQSLDSILMGLKQLEDYVNKNVREEGRPALILEDVSELAKVDLSRQMLGARRAGVKLMRELDYEKAAIYGPLITQVLVNTMAMIAGVHDRIKVFDSRVKAVKWLRARHT